MQLDNGYTEQTEDGITWRIDRLPANDNEPIIYRHLNEDFHGTVDTRWQEEIDSSSENFWAFNHQDMPENLELIDWRALNETTRLNIPIRLNIQTMHVVEEELNEMEECGICYEPIELYNDVTLGCNHRFCVTCINAQLSLHSCSCAFCRAPINSLEVKHNYAFNTLERHMLD